MIPTISDAPHARRAYDLWAAKTPCRTTGAALGDCAISCSAMLREILRIFLGLVRDVLDAPSSSRRMPCSTSMEAIARKSGLAIPTSAASFLSRHLILFDLTTRSDRAQRDREAVPMPDRLHLALRRHSPHPILPVGWSFCGGQVSKPALPHPRFLPDFSTAAVAYAFLRKVRAHSQTSGMPPWSVSTGAVPPANAPVGFLCSATRSRVTEPNRWLLSRQASFSQRCRNR